MAPQLFFHLFALGDVLHDNHRHVRSAFGVEDSGDANVSPTDGAVFAEPAFLNPVAVDVSAEYFVDAFLALQPIIRVRDLNGGFFEEFGAAFRAVITQHVGPVFVELTKLSFFRQQENTDRRVVEERLVVRFTGPQSFGGPFPG